MGLIPDECWNSLLRLSHLALSPSVQWPACFLYCCTLYNFKFCFLGFRQWRSRTDRVVNYTTNWLPLFWRTWTQALASTRPHVLAWHMGRDYSYCRASELTDCQVSGFVHVQAWHMGRDYSYCRASELTDCQVSGFVFSWLLENTEKTKALQETFLRLMPLAGFQNQGPAALFWCRTLGDPSLQHSQRPPVPAV